MPLGEQIKLQKELAQADMIVKGYHKENQAANAKIKELSGSIKALQREVGEAKKTIHELEIKAMLAQDQVYIEEKKEDVDIATQNILGQQNTMTQTQLKELHENMRRVLAENDALKRDWTLKESQLKAQHGTLFDKIHALEKQLYDTEFVVKTKNSDIAKLQDSFLAEREKLEGQLGDLASKVAWFREN